LQFHANPFGNPGGNNWESKFTAAAVAAAAATATGATPANGNSNNLSNLNNPFTMHNLLTSGGGPGNGSNLQWNLTTNHLVSIIKIKMFGKINAQRSRTNFGN